MVGGVRPSHSVGDPCRRRGPARTDFLCTPAGVASLSAVGKSYFSTQMCSYRSDFNTMMEYVAGTGRTKPN